MIDGWFVFSYHILLLMSTARLLPGETGQVSGQSGLRGELYSAQHGVNTHIMLLRQVGKL